MSETNLLFQELSLRNLSHLERLLYCRTTVTRWLDYLVNIGPFTTMKKFPNSRLFSKVGSNFCKKNK